jgi:hypothetical protein
MKATLFLIASSVGFTTAFQSSFIANNRPIIIRQQQAAVSRNDGRSSTNLKMIEGNVAAGIAIGVAGFAAGIGMVTFAEAQVRFCFLGCVYVAEILESLQPPTLRSVENRDLSTSIEIFSHRC